MKRILLAAVFVGSVLSGNAQDYKVARTTGKLQIVEVGDVTIEGYDGKEIIFSSRSGDRERDARAQGLRAISSMGLEDNTGLGLSVKENGDVIEVRQLKKMDGPDIRIKVPKGIVISYSHTSPHGSDFRLKNLENEIQVSTVHNQVELENVTGIVTVKTVHGDIDASFPSGVKERVTLVSVHGHVDIAIPTSTKANLRMGTSWGELFVDPELKLENTTTGGMVKYNDNFNGKLNGGGIDIELSSTHSNVYLRKK